LTLEPLRLSFDVEAPRDHAFSVWTRDIDRWWPADHSQSADPGLTVVLEPQLGGRIFERTSSGAVHEWGVITVWDPPERLGYRWHLRRPAAEATDVLLTFVDTGPGTSRIDVVQSAWERLGDDGPGWRKRNQVGWQGLLPHYVHYLEGLTA
jgi:hypothetical protein